MGDSFSELYPLLSEVHKAFFLERHVPLLKASPGKSLSLSKKEPCFGKLGLKKLPKLHYD